MIQHRQIRFLRIVQAVILSMVLGACATQPPTVAQSLALYDDGEYAKAAEMLNKLAQAGDAQAQQALGVMYENGQGVTKDENLALRLYRQAATNNNESAQYLLGTLLERKYGLMNNQSEAIRWYRQAATNGHPGAQYRMGQIELTGIQGSAPDLLNASDWFGLAAVQGDPQAQLQYGLLLMQCRAGTSDRILGYMWIDIAQGLGDNTSIQTALEAAKSLSANELQRAKNMASQCIKQNYQSCSRLTR